MRFSCALKKSRNRTDFLGATPELYLIVFIRSGPATYLNEHKTSTLSERKHKIESIVYRITEPSPVSDSLMPF